MDCGETPKAGPLSLAGQGSHQGSDLPGKRSRPLLHAVCFSIFFLIAHPGHATPLLTSDLSVSREGYFVLSWSPAEPGELMLQQAGDPAFRTDLESWQVTGTSQFTQSGLVDGDYYYRLQDAAGVSNTVQVRVRHHALSRAVSFFTLGAILFGILVATLMVGHRRQAGGVTR